MSYRVDREKPKTMLKTILPSLPRAVIMPWAMYCNFHPLATSTSPMILALQGAKTACYSCYRVITVQVAAAYRHYVIPTNSRS